MGSAIRSVSQRHGAVALVSVVAALTIAALLVLGLVLVPVDAIGSGDRSVVGEVERVRVSGPDGATVETHARMDTGALSTVIDVEVARALGIDLSQEPGAGVGDVVSVDVAIQIAGVARPATVLVEDRSSEVVPVVLGRSELDGFTVSVGQEHITEPGAFQAPSALSVLLSNHGTAFAPADLIVLLAVAAALVVMMRNVVGMSTLGTFTPILLTISFLQAGLVPALLLTLLVVGVGLLIEPQLRRHRLPRAARLGVLIGSTAVVFIAIESFTGFAGSAGSWGGAFPVVVAAVIVERLWEEWELEGFKPALWSGLRTLAVAILALPVLTAAPVRWLAETAPLALAMAAVIWTWMAGTYGGLRFSELLRFQATTDPTITITPEEVSR